MITLNNLMIGHRGLALTQPISGRFLPGSMTAIVGANGCGKSTLLRTLAGLLPPVSGTLQRQSVPATGWLPQQSELDHHFPITLGDVVAMGSWPRLPMWRGLGQRQRQQVAQAIEQVGLSHLTCRTIDTLSGGQFQRMLFARLLVQDAPVMLMDEPFTGIDSQTSEALLGLMGHLHRQGKTLLVVLHSQDMVQRAFPDTLYLHQEHYHWGPTEQVLTKSPFLRHQPPAVNCPPSLRILP